ncbi:CDF family Co(II)/Ni(II) efflux transporter DmeF [Phenylobacterium sp.]|uniref:CDF family Co(II)/Ni(II) efflux transporter DmeF n=1 Tax=Phenylobacterium sp. TaxID=1871053 RepID=UPI0025D34C44|nr:CDF family Co(II)/Ni(II) efflux transporter DmeF [Phenylobacterium sp.]MBX3484572.1 CDF family Co(II)/Ni(II) efflux transporter DmeF [Phenylobacterium sp.]MCW5759689.1 CDF family Co(II)/Ni(II) efflux transporter DmeF [Phenylobacterium sp.]
MSSTTAPERPDPPEALDAFRADRVYLGADHLRNERRTWIVAAICTATLAALVVGGAATRSMALMASGLHMGAHVVALLVAAAAYALARRHAGNPAFSFGTGKLGYLAGFANGVVLAVTAVLMGVESASRLLAPQAVDYHDALPIAAAGLAVNLVCIWLLRPTGAQASRGDRQGDLNLSAAHLHLTADAAVSVLALLAVLAGRWLHWAFADPLAGLLAAVLVAQFAGTLMRRAGASLLDINPSPELTAEVRRRLSDEGERVIDLHLWRLGPGHHAVIAVIAAAHPKPVATYRARLAGLAGVSHVTVEVRGATEPHDHHHGHGHG